MAEELSTESKLYIKEEIEKVRKEFKNDLKDAQSKATKTFTTVALIIGLLASVGVLSLAKDYAKEALGNKTITDLEAEAKVLHGKIVEYEKDANSLHQKIVNYESQVGKFASKEELKNLDNAIKNHTHTIAFAEDEEKSTGYIKGTGSEKNTTGYGRNNIDEGFVITGVYNDSHGLILYSRKLSIE